MRRYFQPVALSGLALVLTFILAGCGSSSAPDMATPTLAIPPSPTATVRVPSPTPAKAARTTSTPTPMLGNPNLDVDEPPVQFATECIKPDEASPLTWMLPARRATYDWMKVTRGWLGIPKPTWDNLKTILESDRNPDGSMTFDGGLVLDDKRPSLQAVDIAAREAHRFAGIADRYFRDLAVKGAGIWDGCYGMSKMPIMTSRVHFPPIESPCFTAGWQGEAYAEVLYSDNYITQDVATHEWTHGIVDRLLPMAQDGAGGETGALYESLSDTFAVLQRGDGDYKLHSLSGVVRSLQNPSVDHVDKFIKEKLLPRDVKAGQTCTAPRNTKYDNSGIPSKAAYLMIEGLGKEKAGLIYFHALNPEFVKAAAGPGQYAFEEFAQGVFNACTDLETREIGGITTDDCTNAKKAFQAVGMLPVSTPTATVTSGSLAPQASQPTGRLAFVSERDGNREIYVMNADGGEQTNLTRNPAADTQPDWSPDGTRIAFVSDRGNYQEIYVMGADGSQPVRLSSHEYEEWAPDWSPDGQRIVFSCGDTMGGRNLWVMNADGSGRQALTKGSDFHDSPRWSPDGKYIVYALRYRNDGHSNQQIYVMNADGSGVTRLTTGSSTDYAPIWSPDGSKILFNSYAIEGAYELHVMNADGSDRFNEPSMGSILPTWSPGGRFIAVQFGGRAEGSEVGVMTWDGGPATNLTKSRGFDGMPAWSPN